MLSSYRVLKGAPVPALSCSQDSEKSEQWKKMDGLRKTCFSLLSGWVALERELSVVRARVLRRYMNASVHGWL